MGVWLSLAKTLAKSGAKKAAQTERNWMKVRQSDMTDREWIEKWAAKPGEPTGWHKLNLFGYKVSARVYDTDSGMGYGVFNKGRVSKLFISDASGKELFHWDRHLVESHLPDAIVRIIVSTLEKMF